MGITNENWVITLIRGILLSLLGIFVLAQPAATLLVMITFIALYALVIGIIDIIKGIAAFSEGWFGVISIIIGILGVILGLFVLNHLLASLVIYAVLLGLWFIVKGIINIFSPAARIGGSKGLSILVGVLTIVFGILLLDKPILNSIALFWIIGLYALIAGPLTIVSAFITKAEK